MPRVIVFCIVEGQTENAVLTRLIAPHLGSRDIDFHVPVVKTGGGRGGVRFLHATNLYDQAQRFLKDRRLPYVTTMFDYYAFPTSEAKGWEFVGKLKADAAIRGPAKVAELIESELHVRCLEGLDIQNADARFFPYVQLHELEALYFAEPDKMEATFGTPGLAERFKKIVEQCGACESIDDSPQTAPSKRIEAAFPGYVKGRSEFVHGPRLAGKLDLTIVRKECPRFNDWLTKLENLTPC
jgi:hypothetical protein